MSKFKTLKSVPFETINGVEPSRIITDSSIWGGGFKSSVVISELLTQIFVYNGTKKVVAISPKSYRDQFDYTLFSYDGLKTIMSTPIIIGAKPVRVMFSMDEVILDNQFKFKGIIYEETNNLEYLFADIIKPFFDKHYTTKFYNKKDGFKTYKRNGISPEDYNDLLASYRNKLAK